MLRREQRRYLACQKARMIFWQGWGAKITLAIRTKKFNRSNNRTSRMLDIPRGPPAETPDL